MCRNIRTLFNFEPPATEQEIRASAQQFVRKLSGFTQPSHANEAAFERAVDEVADVGAAPAQFAAHHKSGERTGRARPKRRALGRVSGSRRSAGFKGAPGEARRPPNPPAHRAAR